MSAILCVCAHPDDEAFGPAGTICHYVEQGVPVDMITFTKGQVGTTSAGADGPEALGLLRTYETKASAQLLGIRNLTILDYMDGALDKEDLDELTAHVAKAIVDGGIDTVITMGPMGLTNHGDHIAVHYASMRAAEQSTKGLTVFYVAVTGAFAKELGVTGPEAAPTHEIDIEPYFETKLASLACHSSQQDSREFFAMLANGAGPKVEWFHRVQPPYNGDGMARDLFA
jgi:LmbE family N-acetylglucosaminyl deacetylase